MKTYRLVSIVLTLLFAATGLLFLFIPDRVLEFFNNISPSFGMTQSPVTGHGFYLVLAVGYMYLVTFLAFSMYRQPEQALSPASGPRQDSLVAPFPGLFSAPLPLSCLPG